MYGLKESIRERNNADCAQQEAKKAQHRFECLQEIAGAVTVAAIIAGITILFIVVATS